MIKQDLLEITAKLDSKEEKKKKLSLENERLEKENQRLESELQN